MKSGIPVRLTLMTVLWMTAGNGLSPAQGWEVTTVDRGVRPSLEIGTDGIPQISYILEASGGFVKHAVFNPQTGNFAISLADSGYFEGPPDLALDQGNMPHINYHDHTLPDQVHTYLSGGSWIKEPIVSPGHDGWDNSIVIDRFGHPRTSTIDPSIFGGIGVEYAEYDGVQWNVESTGFSFLMYGNGTSLALDSSDRPHITYCNDGPLDLMYAVKDSGIWSVTPIDTTGDSGRYSSLVIDAEDSAHISYFRFTGPNEGVVRYATGAGGNWNMTSVDTLRSITSSYARKVTSLVLDSDGNPRIAYCDRSVLKYASFAGGSWVIDTVVSSPDSTLGQLASLQLDSLDNPHVAYYETTSTIPLDGLVKYASLSSPTSVPRGEELPSSLHLFQNYPNPFNPKTHIRFQIAQTAHVDLRIFDLLGREVATLVNGMRQPGLYSVEWDASGSASGVYVYTLRSEGEMRSRTLLYIK